MHGDPCMWGGAPCLSGLSHACRAHSFFITSTPTWSLAPACMVLGSWSLWLLLFGPRLSAPGSAHACTALGSLLHCRVLGSCSLTPGPWLLALCHSPADGGENEQLYTCIKLVCILIRDFWNQRHDSLNAVYPIKLQFEHPNWHGAAQDYVLLLHISHHIVAPALIAPYILWLLPLYIHGEVQNYSSQSDNVGWCSVAVGAWVGQDSWRIRLYTRSSRCLQRAARNLPRALAIFDHCRRIRLPRTKKQFISLQKALDVWAHLWTNGWRSLLYQYSPIGFCDRLRLWSVAKTQTSWIRCTGYGPLTGFTCLENLRLSVPEWAFDSIVHQCTTYRGTL